MARNETHFRGIRRQAARGFTLVEILIVVVILGILASIVVPQFTNASLMARENTLRDDLRFLRSQVGVYKAQHEDTTPGYPGGDTTAAATQADFIAQMTLHTDKNCNTQATADATFRFGPYLSKMPKNPLNDLDTIKISTAADPTTDLDDTTGWIYNAATQAVVANKSGADNNGAGTPYVQY